MRTLTITKEQPEWRAAHSNILKQIKIMKEKENMSYRIFMESSLSSGFALSPSISYSFSELIEHLSKHVYDFKARQILGELSSTIIPTCPRYMTLSDLELIIEAHRSTEMWIIRN